MIGWRPARAAARIALIALLLAGCASLPPEKPVTSISDIAGEWSAHEVVVHCADSETNAAARIRYVTAEPDPVVLAYDEAEWARRFDYHRHPLEPALAAVEAVRANTVVLLRRLPEEAWDCVGRHTGSGRYAAEDWLAIYAEHLEVHAGQIDANIAAWRAGPGKAT